MDSPGPESEASLIALAVSGDGPALEALLLANHHRLEERMRKRISSAYAGRIGVEDVLQETYTAAFRSIGSFTPDSSDAFYRWLVSLAEHRLQDMIKGLNAAKRGGGRKVLQQGVDPQADSVVHLLELAAAHVHTPSRSAAGHEAVEAVRSAFGQLSPDYEQALRMRYLEGLPVKDIAVRMERTERAVHMLCNRGLKQMQSILGHESRLLSRKW